MGFEYYTLDSSLRRAEVIEGFTSFLWTERYSAAGDFEIVMPSTFTNRQLLKVKTRLGMNKSRYVMVIDTIDDKYDDSGNRNITVTGSSLEALLDDRVAMPAVTDTTTTPNWILTGTPGNIAREMFNHICVNGGISQQDTVPFYHLGTLIGSGDIPESTDMITVSFAPDTLYNSLKKLCDTYALGFRLIKNGDLGQVYFEVYTGNDCTTEQTKRTPVVFDPNLNNLEGIEQITSSASIKTVAYVFASNGSAVVYAPNADPTKSGSDRRVLLVNSSNDGVAGDDLTAALIAEGTLALAAQTMIYTFDGELPSNVPYVYGRDYNLGDLVEERNSDGNGNQMIVTEQIFSSDDQGDRAYPTLTLSQVITPGSWNSWDASQAWNDVPTTEHWGDI